MFFSLNVFIVWDYFILDVSVPGEHLMEAGDMQTTHKKTTGQNTTAATAAAAPEMIHSLSGKISGIFACFSNSVYFGIECSKLFIENYISRRVAINPVAFRLSNVMHIENKVNSLFSIN